MKYLGHNFCDHGKMYLMEMLNQVSEIQNFPSKVSDRDALADEIGSVELRLFCLLYDGTNITDIHWIH